MQQFIKGKRVVVLSVIALSGRPFEDEVKLKTVSVSQESIVTKSGLETELGDIQSQLQCDSLCATLSQHLRASVAEGNALNAQLGNLSANLEALKRETAEISETGEDLEAALEDLGQERAGLTQVIQEGIEFSTALRDNMAKYRDISAQLQTLIEQGHEIRDVVRQAESKWRSAIARS